MEGASLHPLFLSFFYSHPSFSLPPFFDKKRYSVKKERLQTLIAKSKAKLEHLWKELHFSDEQREQFYTKTKGSDDYDAAYLLFFFLVLLLF
jgi:hypothetical protein